MFTTDNRQHGTRLTARSILVQSSVARATATKKPVLEDRSWIQRALKISPPANLLGQVVVELFTLFLDVLQDDPDHPDDGEDQGPEGDCSYHQKFNMSLQSSHCSISKNERSKEFFFQ